MARIGTSGWSYDDWTEVLYPPGTPAGRRLEAYAAVFDTVELNASFYHWPPDRTFAAWRDRLPAGFAMTVKAPRGLTHAKRLAQPEAWIDRIAGGLGELGDRAGQLLVQLAPDHARDDDRLDRFLGLLPDRWPTAVEFRHPSWLVDDVFEILTRHRAAYVVMSGAELPVVPRVTCDRVYVRFHGPDPHRLYAGSYGEEELTRWAERIRAWEADGHRVWAYFNNDGQGNAVRNARTLLAMLRSPTSG